MTTALPAISVVIATFNRACLLEECLQQLSLQPFRAGDEVIVVDNGSTDDTAGVVSRIASSFDVPVRLLRETTPGKSHALARALAVARADVFAFLDDDVNVDPRWLDVIREHMADGSVGLMGGRVLPRWAATVPQWMRRAPHEHSRLGAPLALLDYPPGVVDLGPRTVLGANMAARRNVVEAVGGFATHLGKLRGTLLSGEDHDFCRRVQSAGFRAVYVADAVVRHWVPAERTRVNYFLKWFFWSGITNAILDGESGTGEPARGLPLYLVRRAAVATAKAMKELCFGRPAAALNHVLDVAFAAGYIREQWRPRPKRDRAAKPDAREAA